MLVEHALRGTRYLLLLKNASLLFGVDMAHGELGSNHFVDINKMVSSGKGV
jgi:hypothetical protein